jgi:hypothetical protein
MGVRRVGAPIFSTVESAGGRKLTRRVGEPVPNIAGEPSLRASTGVDQTLTRLVGDAPRIPGDPAPKAFGDSFEGEDGFSRKPNLGVDTTEPEPAARRTGDSFVGDNGAGVARRSGDRTDLSRTADPPVSEKAAARHVHSEVQEGVLSGAVLAGSGLPGNRHGVGGESESTMASLEPT